jgi:hypothetical protein
MEILLTGRGQCSDCGWYMVPEGCNVDRDSATCNLNRFPRSCEAKEYCPGEESCEK